MTELSVTSHYDVLDLPPTATPQEIKRSFRRLARQCHPDVIGWKDPTELKSAEERFKTISYAHDTLVDPIKRSHYDKARSDSRQMYTYAYGYVHIDSDLLRLTGADFVDYDLAWDEFISKPFEWVEKSMRFYNKWSVVFGLLTIVGIVLWVLLGYRYSSMEVFRFMATTQSAPTVESFIPMKVGAVGIALAIASTVTSYVYAAAVHPYSFRRSATFRRQLFDQACGMLMALTYIGVFAGITIGHYLF